MKIFIKCISNTYLSRLVHVCLKFQDSSAYLEHYLFCVFNYEKNNTLKIVIETDKLRQQYHSQERMVFFEIINECF